MNTHNEFEQKVHSLVEVIESALGKEQEKVKELRTSGKKMEEIRQTAMEVGERKEFLRAVAHMYRIHSEDTFGSNCPYMSKNKMTRIEHMLSGEKPIAIQQLHSKSTMYFVREGELVMEDIIAPSLSAYEVGDFSSHHIRGFQTREYLPAF